MARGGTIADGRGVPHVEGGLPAIMSGQPAFGQATRRPAGQAPPSRPNHS